MDEKPSNVKKLMFLWFILSITFIYSGIRSYFHFNDIFGVDLNEVPEPYLFGMFGFCSFIIVILIIIFGCFLLFIFKKVYQGKKQKYVPGFWISLLPLPFYIFLIFGILSTIITNSIEALNFEFLIVFFILLFSNIGILYYSTRPDVKKYYIKSEQEKKYCPNCGRSIPSDAKLCPYCIKKIE